MTNLQRRVKIVQCFSISSRELHSARAAVGDMASKSGGACDRSIFGNHFARLFRCKITPAAVVWKENQPPRRASANPNLQLGPFSDDSDFEPSIRQGGSNKTHQTNNTAKFVKMEQPCNSGKDNACKSRDLQIPSYLSKLLTFFNSAICVRVDSQQFPKCQQFGSGRTCTFIRDVGGMHALRTAPDLVRGTCICIRDVAGGCACAPGLDVAKLSAIWPDECLDFQQFAKLPAI